MQAGQRQREWQAGKFPGEAGKALRGCGSPEWLVAEAPRAALLSAAQSVIRQASDFPLQLVQAGSHASCKLLCVA